MKGKYKNIFLYLLSFFNRELLRFRLSKLIRWRDKEELKPGCSIIIGMCHLLPEIILANLKCLEKFLWKEVDEIIVVVDSIKGCLSDDLVDKARALCGDVSIEFCYYTKKQADVSEKIKLPYVFAWLSWVIGVAKCKNKTFLIHDYDALIIDNSLSLRYQQFIFDSAYMQGIKWYEGNGINATDKLATTFEAFVSKEWVIKYKPIMMFHKIAIFNGVSKDYDILLYMQEFYSPIENRKKYEMSETSLMHPSQMIHQYTMFRRDPNIAQPCYSFILIPFFEWLAGKNEMLIKTTKRIKERDGSLVDILGTGINYNLIKLNKSHVDWGLKQILQVCVSMEIEPNEDILNYGDALYSIVDEYYIDLWEGDFTTEQVLWLKKTKA